MKRLALIDDAFLRIESRRQPLHIGMLMLFEPPAGAGKGWAGELADRLRASTQAAPPFNWRIERRRGLHYWVEDDEFDLAHHFVHTSLPAPGRIRELLAMISRVHGGHIDRAYPLWRIYLVEGLEDGRIAVFLKIHHALVDGVAGLRMLMASMAPSAEESLKLPPPWEINATKKRDAQPLPVPTPAAGTFAALRSVAREGPKAFAPLVREMRDTFADLRKQHQDLVIGGQAPRTLFNDKVSATRRFAAQSYSMARVKKVAKGFDASLNDVVLAMCGAALRRYLSDLGELPDRPLIAAVPVSTRTESDPEFGNAVSFTLCTLATHLDDPAERLGAIRAGMRYNKERLQRLSPAQTGMYAALMMIPGALKAVLGRSPEDALATVCISNVPGPRAPTYWQGAKLTGLYPVSLVTDHGTLNITIITRHDGVDFGLIACRKSVPHMQRLLEYLEDGLTELERAIPETK